MLATILKADTSIDRAARLNLYRQGAEIAELDDSYSSQQAHYAERLGDLHARSRDYPGAADAYQRYLPPDAPLVAFTKLGLCLLPDAPLGALEVLGQVDTVLTRKNDLSDTRWVTRAGLAWGLMLDGRDYEALRAIRDALASLADTSGLGDARSLVRATLGLIHYQQGDHDEATVHLKSARAGWEARGDADGVALMDAALDGASLETITRRFVWYGLSGLLIDRSAIA